MSTLEPLDIRTRFESRSGCMRQKGASSGPGANSHSYGRSQDGSPGTIGDLRCAR